MGVIARQLVYQRLYNFEDLDHWNVGGNVTKSLDSKHYRAGNGAVKFEITGGGQGLADSSGDTNSYDLSGQRILEVWRRINHLVDPTDDWQLHLRFNTEDDAYFGYRLESQVHGDDEFYQYGNARYFKIDRDHPYSGQGWPNWNNIKFLTLHTFGDPLKTLSVTLDDLRFLEPSNVPIARAGA